MIETKPKKCKGIGKAISVKGCGEMYLHRTYGLCSNCLADFLFGTDCGQLILRSKVIPKAKANVKKESKAKDKVAREGLRKKSYYEKQLQTEINAIVKYLDAGYPCISSGLTTGKRNAGHRISIGSNSTIRYHLENIWNQSEYSNTHKSGDLLNYNDGIVSLYGKEYLNRLESLKSIEPIKLSIDELKEKTYIARSIVKWLKLQDRQFTLQERLEYRIRFNEQIGIYQPNPVFTPNK